MQILPGELQKGAGTGLGLSISQNLIRIHGGEIGHVTPESGRGSEFYLEVPMKMQFRGTTGSKKGRDGSTPSGSLRAVQERGLGEDKRDQEGGMVGIGLGNSSDTDDDEDEDGVIGALPLNEDRQEEDAIIREITDLQQQQQKRLSASMTPSLEGLQLPHLSSLYVSRPNVSSPDSSMRVLTQQRMHAAHLRQSSQYGATSGGGSGGGSVASPSILHSSRRLVALAQVPVSGVVGEEEDLSGHTPTTCNSTGSRSVSLVMNDAHGPSSSPLLSFKRSPLLNLRKAGSSLGQGRGGEEKEGGGDGDGGGLTGPPEGVEEEEGGPEAGERSNARLRLLQGSANPLILHSNSAPSVHSHHQPTHTSLSSFSSISPGRGAAAESNTPPPRSSNINVSPSSSSSTSLSATSPSRSDLYITLATYGQANKSLALQPTFSPSASGLSPLRLSSGTTSAIGGSVSSMTPFHPPSSRAIPPPHQGNLEEEKLPAEEAQGRPTDSASTSSSSPSFPLPSSSTSSSSSSSSSSHSNSVSGGSSNSSLSSTLPTFNFPAPSTSISPTAGNLNGGGSTSTSSPTLPRAVSATVTEATPNGSSTLSGSGESLSVRTSLSPTVVGASDPSSSSPNSASEPRSPPPSSVSAAVSPISLPTPSSASPASQTSAAPPALPSGPRSLRVLVAEDSVPNLKLLLVLLRKMKAECKGVENGQLAVDEFSVWYQAKQRGDLHFPLPYDLLLIDGNMPILGGIDATRQLRSMGVSIPIYAVTGNAMAEDTLEFLRAGANSPVLTKPIQQKELMKIIETQQAILRKEWKANHKSKE